MQADKLFLKFLKDCDITNNSLAHSSENIAKAMLCYIATAWNLYLQIKFVSFHLLNLFVIA